MAFRLTKDQLRQKETLLATLRPAEQALDDAVTAYNQAIEQAKAWVQETTDTIRREYDSKSERWQEGHAGLTVSEWLDAWDDVDADPVELPDSVADAIENLSDHA
jgi:outer membrane protein TolC